VNGRHNPVLVYAVTDLVGHQTSSECCRNCKKLLTIKRLLTS